MGLSPEQQQELAELEELDQLEQKFGSHSQPQAPKSISEGIQRFKDYNPSDETRNEAARHPYTGMDDPLYQAMGMLSPGGVSVTGLGNLLRKGGDKLMQKSVGITKAVPGVGETLAQEGLMGTKGMLRKQIENGLETRGQQIGDLAQSVPSVSTRPVAEKLGEQASKLTSPQGEVIPDNIRAYHKYVEEATKASQEGSITGAEAASRRSQYGKVARDAGRYRDNPAQGLKAQMAGQQQAGYSQALKDAAGPELAQADKAYGALSSAANSISRPESISTMGMVGKSIPMVIGGAVGGIPGAAAGAAIGTPLVQSVAGRAAIGAGKGMQRLPVGAAPMTLHQLLKPRDE